MMEVAEEVMRKNKESYGKINTTDEKATVHNVPIMDYAINEGDHDIVQISFL